MAVEAVIFDWGGTLTPWRSVDFEEEARALAAAAVDPHPEAAEALAQELVAAGLTVLYDDRPKVSPGVKFKDAELLGMPTIVGTPMSSASLNFTPGLTLPRRSS